MLISLLLIFVLVLINSAGQIFLKLASLRKEKRFAFLFFGYGLFLISVFLVQILLNYIEFKSLAIVITLNIVGVMVASAIFLNEKLTRQKVTGTLVVVVGSVIFLAQGFLL